MSVRLSAAALALAAVACPFAVRAADPDATPDEQLLREARVGVTPAALEAFFRRRTPTAADTRRAAALVRQLGDEDFVRREAASRELVRCGPAAEGALRQAQRDTDPEVAARATQCLEEIAPELDPVPVGAAARLLVARAPGRAGDVLLAHLPFAAEGAADEVADALATLASRPGRADAALRGALADRRPVVRAAAARALGRSPDASVRPAVRALLQDADPAVRLAAAEGLLAGHDKEAVPVLIALSAEAPAELRERAELHLLRLAGEKPPELTNGRTRRSAWEAWWAANGPRIDLARLAEAPPYLGLTLVPEMHAGKVWECGKDGKPLWEVGELLTPIDAQVLPGRRLLVAELNGGRVTERDRTGRVLWEYRLDTPIACQRLPGGDTFLATNHRVFVVNRAGKEVFAYAPEAGFFIHSTRRLDDGHVVLVSMAGMVREIDAGGKVVCSVDLPGGGGWSGVEGAPGGHYLAVNNSQGRVVEVDRKGAVVWEYSTAGACYASRLPGGNTLVVSNASGLLEVDRRGHVVWSRAVTTSLWRAHRR
jgi:hypothetical protein